VLESDLGAGWIQKPVDLDVLAEMIAKSIKE
jgi:hypothetical protein